MNDEKIRVELTVNGDRHTVTVASDETLVTTLRRELRLNSVRTTCDIGICGACTVLVDGLPVSGCLTLTALSEGQEILTSEGLLENGEMVDPLQQAFVANSAFQCSYCTPAMVLTARSLLKENPSPGVEEIREYMAGNLCRCGSHPHVIEAVQSVASKGGGNG